MRNLYLLGTLILLSFSAIAGNGLRANLSFCSFLSPQDGPFLETYLSVNAATLSLQPVEGGFAGSVEVMMIIKKGEKIADFRKYELKSPVIEDTNQIAVNFIDQQRFVLDSGTYLYEISIRDLKANGPAITHSQEIRISFPEGSVSLSGIQLLDSYRKSTEQGILTKSGFDLIPYVFNFYPESVDRIRFYLEIYGTEKAFGEGGGFLVNQFVQGYETGEPVKELQRRTRQKAAQVVPMLQEFDLSRLPSGNYNLVTEVRNAQNEIIANGEVFFQRMNPNVQLSLDDIRVLDVRSSFVEGFNNTDSLSSYIRSLQPISSEMERVFAENHLASADLALMQQYFLNFWLSRDELNPRAAWEEYYSRVKHVDLHFSTLIKHGYETDRGIVYLKYGPPNTISESHHEPSAYPYEIWHYYELRQQRNKKFVFCSRDNVTNDFELIHSDAMGEISNYRWQIDVMRRTTDGFDLDQRNTESHWGGKIDTYYRDPR